MLKILVTYAVQGEFTEIKWPDVEVYYVRTGIGKVKSAFHLSEAIQQVKPDIVINQGTAGTINHQVGDVFVCRQLGQEAITGIAGCRFGPVLAKAPGSKQFRRINTVFHSQSGHLMHIPIDKMTDIEGDVVDMEAYAQAFVCRAKEIPFISVKYVSDVIGQNSVKHWEDRLEDARAGLSHFFNVLKESI